MPPYSYSPTCMPLTELLSGLMYLLWLAWYTQLYLWKLEPPILFIVYSHLPPERPPRGLSKRKEQELVHHLTRLDLLVLGTFYTYCHTHCCLITCISKISYCLDHLGCGKSKDLSLPFFCEVPAASRKVVKQEGDCGKRLGVTWASLSILGRFWNLEVLTTKHWKHFCLDKLPLRVEIRIALSSLVSIATLATIVGKGIRWDGRRGKGKRVEMVWGQARPELTLHLSLTMFKCSLVTSSNFLQKRKEIVLKISRLSSIAKATFFKCIIIGKGSVQACIYHDDRKYIHMNFLWGYFVFI